MKLLSDSIPGVRRQGFALVLVLAMLVLVAGLITAYFSRALQERRAGASSVSGSEADLLAAAVTQMVLDDFLDEIATGSEKIEVEGVRLYKPLLIPPEAGEGVPLAISMAPQLVPEDELLELPSVVKISRSGARFFEGGPGYEDGVPGGAARVSGVGSGETSLNGRAIARASWNAPLLMTPDEFDGNGVGGFVSPDWIYVDRGGRNPTSFGAEDMEAARNAQPDNDDFVLGRYAYVVYDVGGLLDINVAGNLLDEEENAHRGRLHQVSLEQGIGGVELEGIADLVGGWRWPGLAENQDALMDPRRDFMNVEEGHQAFVNRTDLVAHAREGGLPEAALPYLTTFSRALNAPHWRPDPERPKLPAEPDPDALNPDLLDIRFEAEATLSRGGDPAVVVPAGTPVMPRRFPLGKLDLFNETNPNAEDLEYYFGLERVTGEVDTFDYVRATGDGRMARLDEVAADGREPNFFEILQAVIITGSLGKHAGNSTTFDWARDELRNRQVLQIGANIIDQWDGDDIPTTIRFPSGDPDEPMEVYGTENLPYIHQFTIAPWRPAYERNLMQLWMLFHLWNPHQNALTPPQGIDALRIIPLAGEFHNFRPTYMIDRESGSGLLRSYVRASELTTPELNEEWDFQFSSFPSSAGYAEVVTVGAQEPEEPGAAPGVLLWEHDLSESPEGSPQANPAIPPYPHRPPSLQQALNDLFEDDAISTYTASNSRNDPPHTVLGERSYPPGTTFSGLDTSYWGQRQDAEGNELVYANFAVKAHNRIRHLIPAEDGDFSRTDPSWTPGSPPMDFALQARVNGDWKTYQRLEGYYKRLLGSGGNGISRNVQSTSDHPGYVLNQHTHHSVLTASELEALIEDPQKGSFYEWVPNTRTFTGADPRTQRLGFYDLGGFGTPIRSNTQAWNGGNNHNGWPLLRQLPDGLFGFDFYRPGSRYSLAGLVTNVPYDYLAEGVLNGHHPTRYADRDGVVRPGDGFFGFDSGVLPTVPGRFGDRPVILNRPFRSVADLGYAFRDLPWKSLDFSSRYSGDLGLLDVFSLEESVGDIPVVAGKVNLNTRRPEVLQALLRDTLIRFAGIHAQVDASQLSDGAAQAIAEAVVDESFTMPYASTGDVVPRVLHRELAAPLLPELLIKSEREAAIRTLAALGQTRTWNLMIDLVAQSGRFTAASQDGADFSGQRGAPLLDPCGHRPDHGANCGIAQGSCV